MGFNSGFKRLKARSVLWKCSTLFWYTDEMFCKFITQNVHPVHCRSHRTILRTPTTTDCIIPTDSCHPVDRNFAAVRYMIHRVRQKYLTILQNSCKWNRWRGEFVLERSSSETPSISVAMERRSVEHRAFAVETYFKNNDSVLTQRIFRRHFNIHRNECP